MAANRSISARSLDNVEFLDLLDRLAEVQGPYAIIGSSALQLHGLEVRARDVDVFSSEDVIGNICEAVGASRQSALRMNRGDAELWEFETAFGYLDVYVRVSGGIELEEVRENASWLHASTRGAICVASLSDVRRMRAASVPFPEDELPSHVGQHERVIAIDGPAGAGKSTVARAVAEELGYEYFESGALYRAFAYALLQAEVDPDDHRSLTALARTFHFSVESGRVFVGTIDATEQIRAHKVAELTSHVAAFPEVRRILVERQRELLADGHFVVDGRDTGTVVTPTAPVKIFLTASSEERARRRARETGEDVSLIEGQIRARDLMDTQRKHGALKAADDAVHLDTTRLTSAEAAEQIVRLARDRGLA